MKLIDQVNSRIVTAQWRRKGVRGLEDATFVGRPIFSTRNGAYVEFGRRMVSVSVVHRQVIGVNHRTIIRAIDEHARIVIGDDCGLSGATIVCKNQITIGDGALIGANVCIVDTDFHPARSTERRYAPIPPRSINDAISIGNNVFIGMNALILKGTTLGDDVVVGAGAVVRGRFPSGSVIVGNPAREVGASGNLPR